MNIDSIQKSYRRQANLYDFYFGPVLQHGRKEVLRKIECQPNDHVLEVGVGTGLSLDLYPANVYITGIDISPEMLERAQRRADRKSLKNVVDLKVMDAESMDFADDSFDKVVAMYVASVVANPAKLVDEMRRVCKPGGDIFIVNHFQHNNKVIASMERLVAPLGKYLGWRPDFSMEQFMRDTNIQAHEHSRVNMFGYWTLLRAINDKDTEPRAMALD